MYTSGINQVNGVPRQRPAVVRPVSQQRPAATGQWAAQRTAQRTAQTFHQRCAKITGIYAGIAAFCVVFCLIYEQFSFGEHSDAMRRMFLVPLLGGVLPFALLAASDLLSGLSRVAFNLWNSGIAVLVSGCLITGIIEISGRVSDYSLYYWIAGGVFLAAAVVAQTVSLLAVSR